MVELAKQNKWKDKPDKAGADDRYRLQVEISQLTKKEAIELRAKIHILLQEESPDYQAFINFDLLDVDVLNENTGRYTQTPEDKY